MANRLKWGLTVIAAMLVCNPEELGQQRCMDDSLVLGRDSRFVTDFKKIDLETCLNYQMVL